MAQLTNYYTTTYYYLYLLPCIYLPRIEIIDKTVRKVFSEKKGGRWRSEYDRVSHEEGP